MLHTADVQVDAAGVGVTVIQGSSGLVVDCYAPPPLPRVITEQGGQVVDWSWTTTGPSATRVVIGGQGAQGWWRR